MLHPSFLVGPRRALRGACLAALLVGGQVFAQDSYYVNSGLNQQKDTALAEFGIDLGGFIPFSAFNDPAHAYNQGWTGAQPLWNTMFDNITNLYTLNPLLQAGSPLGGVTPLVTLNSFTNGTTWWNGASIGIWDYTVNGAPLLVVRRLGMASPPSPVHLLLVNTPQHFSDFAPSLPGSAGFTSFPEWPFNSSGQPNLSIELQACERGDVVAIVKENLSADFWIALQRTQDAEFFLRQTFMPAQFPGEQVGFAYLTGGSWGSQMSGMLALFQPGVYAGAAGMFGTDIGYLMASGDWERLVRHFWAATAGAPPTSVHSNTVVKDFWLLVDILGIRFDHPAAGMQPWDVGAFSQNHRPFELKVKNQDALLGTEDVAVNWHWEQKDNLQNPNFVRRYVANTEHGGYQGLEVGMNELSFFTGSEWSTLLGATTGGPQPPNIPLVPATAPTADANPDPYSHTLRHLPVAPGGPGDTGLLAELDVNPDSNVVKSIGQGAWPGHFDNLQVKDIDGDGNVEVCFGNFDGFFHVLQVDPNDNTRLVDEWKSPALGFGLYATAAEPNNAGFFVGDSLGRIHHVLKTGVNSYSVVTPPFASPATVPALYEGVLPMIVRGEFHPNPGTETLVLNHYLDWVLLDANGNQLDRWWRGTVATGPGMPTRVGLADGDNLDELLVPALDGHLWTLQWSQANARLEMTEFLPFTGRALYRVEPVHLQTGTRPSHLLLFGRDDNLSTPDRVMLVKNNYPAPSTIVADVGVSVDLHSPAFAWITPPAGGSATFVVGGSGAFTLQKVTVTTTSIVPSATVTVPGFNLCAVETGTVAGSTRVFAAMGNGRIYMLDSSFAFLRESDDEWANDPNIPAGAVKLPWHSNRTLAHTFAFDLWQDPTSSTAQLYFAEFAQPLFTMTTGTPPEHYRTGKIEVLNAPGTWDPYEFDAISRNQAPILNHFFRYADIDGNNTPEPYFQSESGAVYKEAATSLVRQFSNTCQDQFIFVNLVPPGIPSQLGGHVFEFHAQKDFSVLDGFTIPKQTGVFDNGSATNWWYPKVGTNFIGGQVANPSQGVYGIYQGTSMCVAKLPRNGVLVDHVVTGTAGGLVYALRPGPKAAPGVNQTPAVLGYATGDLGWNVIGMDAANLDADPEDEIVVGTFMDDGHYPDWIAGQQKKNRGHCLILDANPVNGRLTTVADLDADGLLGLGNGVTSGVFGVKTDDVNGDGTREIWAGDAAGHIYLFKKQAGAWVTHFRSPSVGPYPGQFNHFFPVKDANGHTIRLAVASGGYVMLFEVNWPQV